MNNFQTLLWIYIRIINKFDELERENMHIYNMTKEFYFESVNDSFEFFFILTL